MSGQLGLFDTDRMADQTQATMARERMRTMIDRLVGAAVPPWKDHMAAILDDGAFQRAMRLVPADEAQALQVEYDAQTERLCAIWDDLDAAAQG